MKNLRIATQVSLAFAVMVLLVLASAVLVWVEAQQSQHRAEAARRNIMGAVALSNAESALWQLRYGFPQYMTTDEAGRRKITEDEPKFYALISEALAAYAATHPSGQELQSLKALQDVYGKYIAARPKWFELFGAGKLDEAREWRAATTTPFGAGTVKAFSELIDLQQKVSQESHLAGLDELRDMRRLMGGLVLLAVVIGVLLAATTVRALQAQLGGEFSYAKEVAARIAGRDLTAEVDVRQGDSSSMLWAMKKMSENLRSVVGEVVASARTVAETSAQIAQGNSDLSQRTEEQAGTLEETASSLEELTSTVAQNAENARQATQLAVGASEVARKGGRVVNEVVTTMTGISDSSRKISDIIGVIDGIAFQTNILALNAAVEAARAGEQGRGFAVVAAEVRNLAQRSAGAAKEIKSLIGDSVQKVDAGTKLVDAAGRTMEEIVTSVQQVSDLIAEIANASREQSSGIEQVNAAVAQMEQVVQQNASLVEEAAAATESMKEQAGGLLRAVSLFDLGAGAATLQPGGLPRLQPAAPALAVAPIRVRPTTVRERPAAAPARKGPTAEGNGAWTQF